MGSARPADPFSHAPKSGSPLALYCGIFRNVRPVSGIDHVTSLPNLVVVKCNAETHV